MSTEETKHTEDKTAPPESGFGQMSQMMSQMMNMCCTAEGGFPDCSIMMKKAKNPVQDQSSTPQNPNSRSEEGKK